MPLPPLFAIALVLAQAAPAPDPPVLMDEDLQRLEELDERVSGLEDAALNAEADRTALREQVAALEARAQAAEAEVGAISRTQVEESASRDRRLALLDQAIEAGDTFTRLLTFGERPNGSELDAFEGALTSARQEAFARGAAVEGGYLDRALAQALIGRFSLETGDYFLGRTGFANSVIFALRARDAAAQRPTPLPGATTPLREAPPPVPLGPNALLP